MLMNNITKLYVLVYNGKKYYFTTETERAHFLNMLSLTDKYFYGAKIQKYIILLEDI